MVFFQTMTNFCSRSTRIRNAVHIRKARLKAPTCLSRLLWSLRRSLPSFQLIRVPITAPQGTLIQPRLTLTGSEEMAGHLTTEGKQLSGGYC